MIKLNNRIEKQIDALVGALTDPIVVFDPGWADVLPDWLKGEIKMQRLAQLMKAEEGIATDAEALAYVSNASLSQPIASDWVDIYQYLLTKVMRQKVPEEMRKDILDDYRMGLLRELKEWILRQRVKARQERRRAERARARADAEALYRLLEEKIVPLYYERDRSGVPHGWIHVVRDAIRSIVPMFCARRMLKEYTERMYVSAAQSLKHEKLDYWKS